MTKIVAFGCSYTYGHGLYDCLDKKSNGPGPNPSNYTYLQHLAVKLKIDTVLNLAQPGVGNKYIMHKLDTNLHKINKEDIVIIQWSFIDRFSILHNSEDTTNLGPWKNKNNKISAGYYKHLYSEYDNRKHTSWYINCTNSMLKHKGVTRIINTEPPDEQFDKSTIIDQDSYWEDCLPNHSVDRASDGNHPGLNSHRRYAEAMYLAHKHKFLKWNIISG
jgi:hypothetical protein